VFQLWCSKAFTFIIISYNYIYYVVHLLVIVPAYSLLVRSFYYTDGLVTEFHVVFIDM